jgi:hypothetical protein
MFAWDDYEGWHQIHFERFERHNLPTRRPGQCDDFPVFSPVRSATLRQSVWRIVLDFYCDADMDDVVLDSVDDQIADGM